MDLFDRMLELSKEGFFCAQILLKLALESEGKDNPDLLRAMGGLNGGLGFSGNVCGALTGGCCLISYYAGKGEAEELEDQHCNAMIAELVRWFSEECVIDYGGNSCNIILDGNPGNKMQRCPGIVEQVYLKAMDLLAQNGVLG